MSDAAVDLSQVAAPAVIEAVDYETILADLISDFVARDQDYSALLESDPAYKVLEVAAYREMVLKQQFNDRCVALMLAYAGGTDLDNFAANRDMERLVIDEGDPNAVPPIEPTYESDDSFRKRIQLWPESLTAAGSSGSYQYHTLSASALVKDVDVSNPAAGEVLLTVLSTEGDGSADQPLLDTVAAAVTATNVRPLTDKVSVAGSTIINYVVDAVIYVYDGPDANVVLQSAQTAIAKYVNDHHALGHDITLSGIYAALHQPGVQRVELAAPAATIAIAPTAAGYCTSISVTLGGTDE
ncbi:baseplate J/gp47 family protein [Desulfuromonas acetoxidans]|uniref:baseplate assembly protein n=1 Tax=Desulfuromonas acetoxidans TaxID=891 RepID=UPI00292F5F02|nr:baseplate J/gp47 family protein [Desulfuromonas acetoxidans]